MKDDLNKKWFLIGCFCVQSEQQLTSCAVADGCAGYGGPAAIYWLSRQGGLNNQSSYPYTSGSNGVVRIYASTASYKRIIFIPKLLQSGACLYKPENNNAAILASNPVTQIQPREVNAMMTVLANRRLVMVGICATDSFVSYKYISTIDDEVLTALKQLLNSYWFFRSGVYTDPNCPLYRNHAVVIVGYGTANGLDYWVNS